MVGVYHHVVRVGHLAVEVHSATAAHLRHILHAAHELVLGDDYRSCGFAKRLERHVVHGLAALGGVGLEYGLQVFLLFGGNLPLLLLILTDKVIHHIRIDTYELGILELTFEHLHKVAVELAIHHHNVVLMRLCCLDEAVLRLGVVAVDINYLAILVGLLLLNGLAVLLEGVVLAINILKHSKLSGAIVELLVGKHAVLHEELQVGPLLLVGFALVLEEGVQAVGHLLGDVVRNLLNVGIGLQVAARYVKRNIGRVDNPV